MPTIGPSSTCPATSATLPADDLIFAISRREKAVQLDFITQRPRVPRIRNVDLVPGSPMAPGAAFAQHRLMRQSRQQPHGEALKQRIRADMKFADHACVSLTYDVNRFEMSERPAVS